MDISILRIEENKYKKKLEKYEQMKSQYEGQGNGEELQYKIKEVPKSCLRKVMMTKNTKLVLQMFITE